MKARNAVVVTECGSCGEESHSSCKGPWLKTGEGVWELDAGVARCPKCGSSDTESRFDDGGMLVPVEDVLVPWVPPRESRC